MALAVEERRCPAEYQDRLLGGAFDVGYLFGPTSSCGSATKSLIGKQLP